MTATFGLYIIVPILVRLGLFYSNITGFGTLLVLPAVYGFVTVGWQGVIGYFIAKTFAGSITMVIEFILTKIAFSRTGSAITMAETNFFKAYEFYADKLGVTTETCQGNQAS